MAFTHLHEKYEQFFCMNANLFARCLQDLTLDCVKLLVIFIEIRMYHLQNSITFLDWSSDLSKTFQITL